jgi:hypothetical protein
MFVAQAANKPKPKTTIAKATVPKSTKAPAPPAAPKGSVQVRVINLAVHRDGRTEQFDVRSLFDTPSAKLKPLASGLRFGESRTISVPLARDGSYGGFNWALAGSTNRLDWFAPPGTVPIGKNGGWNTIEYGYSPGLDEAVLSFGGWSTVYDPRTDFDGIRAPAPGKATVYVRGSAVSLLFDNYWFRAIAGAVGQGCLAEAHPSENTTRLVGGTDPIAYVVSPGPLTVALYDPDDTSCSSPISASLSVNTKTDSLTYLETIGTSRDNLKILLAAEG